MKKSVIIRRIILVTIFAAAILLTPVLLFIKTPSDNKTIKWTSTIEVKDGVTYPESESIDFKVDKAGEYSLRFNLIPDRYDGITIVNYQPNDHGFISVLVVTDSRGEIVYSSTQGAATIDTYVSLKPDNYKVTYYYFSDEDKFYDYESTYICSSNEASQMAKSLNFPRFNKDSKTVFNYSFLCVSKNEELFFPSIMLSWGLIVGLLGGILVAEFFFFGKSGEKKYDERQILEQGKAFKIGFFTMMIIFEVLILINLCGFSTLIDSTVFYQIAIFIGLLAYVVYCIWTESYFAINEKTNRVIIAFAIIAIVNLIIGILNMIAGQIVVDGRITFKAINPVCALVFLIIFGVMLVKRIVNSKKSSSDEDEEDD